MTPTEANVDKMTCCNAREHDSVVDYSEIRSEHLSFCYYSDGRGPEIMRISNAAGKFELIESPSIVLSKPMVGVFSRRQEGKVYCGIRVPLDKEAPEQARFLELLELMDAKANVEEWFDHTSLICGENNDCVNVLVHARNPLAHIIGKDGRVKLQRIDQGRDLGELTDLFPAMIKLVFRFRMFSTVRGTSFTHLEATGIYVTDMREDKSKVAAVNLLSLLESHSEEISRLGKIVGKQEKAIKALEMSNADIRDIVFH